MHRLLRIYSKIILLVGWMAGFIACSKDNSNTAPSGTNNLNDTTNNSLTDTIADEYGCPYATYRVIGTVNDEHTNKPIANIQVNGNVLYGSTSIDTTDKAGQYELEGESIGDTEFTIILTDPDSTDGLYQSDTVHIRLVYTGGDGNWDEGHADAGKDIYLKKIDK